METLTEQDFERAADATLCALDGALSDLDGLEVDLESGILTLEFADGVRYVVNSHRAARQIWMAAERNAWHFDLRAEADGESEKKTWLATKSGDELWSTLEGVVARKLQKPVKLSR